MRKSLVDSSDKNRPHPHTQKQRQSRFGRRLLIINPRRLGILKGPISEGEDIETIRL
jgi:hypothetical protein